MVRPFSVYAVLPNDAIEQRADTHRAKHRRIGA